jgi:hypothetical protein
MQKCFLLPLLSLLAFGQSNDVLFGGIQLKLGLTEDTVLARFVSSPFQAQEINGSYLVLTKRGEVWATVGYLTFEAGKLSRIAVENYNADGKDAVALAKAAYTAIAAGERAGLVDVWTARNEDANNPMYAVHLVFKDREVQISTIEYQNTETASVQTYYPRIKANTKADSKRTK